MADYQYLTDSGVIVPDTTDILTGVETEWQTSFGSDLVVDPETPQGVIINSEALARSEVVRNNAAVANQINPTIAGGVFLKALCALTGLDAPAATFSTIAAVGILVTGQPGTTIPSGSQARTDDGDLFETTDDVTLDGAGNGAVGFQAVVAGPVPAPAAELTNIVTNVLGWETVNNTSAAVLGQTELADEELRRLRNNSLALQGSTLAESITSAVAVVAGVHSQQFRENKTGVTATIDGIVLVAHSVWSCVQGGTDDAVAAALLASKSGGCNWNGAVTVNVVDPASGQTYAVQFDRPDEEPVLIRITAKAPAAAINPVGSIKQAVEDYANGLVPDQAGFIVGGAVSPFEIAGAVMSEVDGVYVRKVEVALVSSGVFQTTEIALNLNQLATIDPTNITVILV
jgi:hypothetical protein